MVALIDWMNNFLSLPLPGGDTIWALLLKSLIWLIVVVVGGQLLISLYSIQRKKREQRIELARFIKERQYEALQEMYAVFAAFMQLFREINAPHTDLTHTETRKALFDRIVRAEAEVDAIILRIACEFSDGSFPKLADMLGRLRQSAQIWRERVQESEKLPFFSSDQEDYMDFKNSIAQISAYLAGSIFQSMEPAKVSRRQTTSLLHEAFDNRYERKFRF